MLSRTLESDVQRNFDEIQQVLNSKQVQIEALVAEWAALKARVAALESERTVLWEEVWTL